MNTSPRTLRPLATALLLAAAVPSLHAANVASDDASNNPPYPTDRLGGGLATGQNGGSGFGPFTINANSAGFAGTFIDDSSRNGGNTSNINTGDRLAFAFYAGNGGSIEGIRPLTGGALSIGQSISLSLDNGNVQNGSTVGFGFRDASGANRLMLSFTGGTNAYVVSGTTDQASAHGFTQDGLRGTFTLTGTDTYSFALNFNATANAPASTETFSGLLVGTAGGGITDIRVFDNNAGSDVYFNSLTVVPEPSTTFLTAFGALAVGLLVWPRLRRLA